MEDRDPVQEWAKVKLALRESFENTLKVHGLSYDGFRELEQQALAVLMGQETASTEYGTVRKIGKPAYLHKNSVKMAETFYLTLDRKSQ